MSLNYVNALNVLGFALTWVLNSSVAQVGPGAAEGATYFWSGMQSLQMRYESIVNPVGITYLIAHLILLLEGVFAVTQLLPKYRSSPMVQEGVTVWFFISAVAQFLWSIDLGVETTLGSAISVAFMGIMLFSLSKILMTQAAKTDSTQTPEEYWLLRFPFSIHFAWVLAVFVESINGFFVQLGFGTAFQLVLGFLSLFFFAGVGYKMLFANGQYPNYAIPAVLAWFAVSLL